MLAVQNYLQNHSIDQLCGEYGFSATYHATNPLVILNYSQIDSPKTDPITRECRALVLDTRDNSVVAKAFTRFFNWGEHEEEMDRFDFRSFDCVQKEDGSLFIIFEFEGDWFFATRKTFADFQLENGPQGFTWQMLAEHALGLKREQLANVLDPRFTYVCELASTANQVVRLYPKPVMFLTGLYDRVEKREYTEKQVDEYASKLVCFQRPQHFTVRTLEEVRELIDKIGSEDRTWEGVIIRDRNNIRFKVKNPEYLKLHYLRTSMNVYSLRGQLPFILAGEDAEVLAYFPDIREAYNLNKKLVEDTFIELAKLWRENWRVDNQKEFALSVKHHPLAALLFQYRKTAGEEQTEQGLRHLYNNSPELLEKVLAKKSQILLENLTFPR